jgi:hypothetical protein
LAEARDFFRVGQILIRQNYSERPANKNQLYNEGIRTKGHFLSGWSRAYNSLLSSLFLIFYLCSVLTKSLSKKMSSLTLEQLHRPIHKISLLSPLSLLEMSSYKTTMAKIYPQRQRNRYLVCHLFPITICFRMSLFPCPIDFDHLQCSSRLFQSTIGLCS